MCLVVEVFDVYHGRKCSFLHCGGRVLLLHALWSRNLLHAFCSRVIFCKLIVFLYMHYGCNCLYIIVAEHIKALK